MNKQGKGGFMVFVVWCMIFIAAALIAFSFIDPLKETYDVIRGGSALNCVGTPTFNQANFDAQNDFERLVYRPTCFVTGLGMVWFVGSILIIYGAVTLGKLKK